MVTKEAGQCLFLLILIVSPNKHIPPSIIPTMCHTFPLKMAYYVVFKKY